MEHEITGHTIKAYKIWNNPAMPFWRKFKEIGIEILIIVFAVSLAAFLERAKEHSAEQKQVKEFLLGLKTDLQSDINEMTQDKKSYTSCGETFRYITSLKPGQPLSKDSISKYYRFIYNTTGLLPNDGRYQGFKSSGKISTIGNKVLQNDILDLYQEDITTLLSSTNAYTARKEVLFRYLFENVKRNQDGTTNVTTVLASDQSQNVCGTLAFVQEILDRYDGVIAKSKKIIAEIDAEYK